MSEKEIFEKIESFLSEKKEKEIFQRIEDFRSKRLDDIKKNEITKPLLDGSKFVLHLIPYNSFRSPKHYDLLTHLDKPQILKLFRMSHFTRTYNFDGLFYYFEGNENKCSAYIQVFTSGIIETVDTRMLGSLGPTEKKIYVDSIEDEIIMSTKEGLQIQKELNIDLPIILYLAVLDVKGFRVPDIRIFPHRSSNPVDREDLVFPKLTIDDFEVIPEEILKTTFDRLWNACGFSGSANYDEKGKRITK